MANDHESRIIVGAKDNTGQSFKLIGTKFKGLQTDVSGLARTLGTAALVGGAALTAFLVSAAKSAGEAQASLVRVTTTLTAMGAAALKNKDAILQAADAAVKLGFDDEAAAESITKLYQRTNDLTKAQELSALAMDLARDKQISLGEATAAIGMVLSGNARALKAYGIELDETKTPLEALGELHDKVKGQAQAFAGTFQGQMLVINESVSNMKDTLGAALLEGIAPFVQELTVWASNPDVQAKVKAISAAVGEFATVALPVAIETIKLWKAAFDGIVEVLGTVIYNIQRAIDAVTAFKRAIEGAISRAGEATGNAIRSTANFLTGGLIPKAAGGPVSAGGSYLVGERGPERFVPSTSGHIIPNGGGNITINISGNTLLDASAGEKIGKQIMETLKGNLRI